LVVLPIIFGAILGPVATNYISRRGERRPFSNKLVIGESSFRQRKDGTWYDPRTGEDLVVLSVKEFMEKYDEE
jgi:hypothetical protein